MSSHRWRPSASGGGKSLMFVETTKVALACAAVFATEPGWLDVARRQHKSCRPTSGLAAAAQLVRAGGPGPRGRSTRSPALGQPDRESTHCEECKGSLATANP